MQPQLDPEKINMLQGLRNGAFLPQLLRTYREQSLSQLTGIRNAISSKDAVTLRSITHSLKSASMSIGASKIGSLCADLETLGRAGTTAGSEPICAELEQLHAALMTETEQYL